MGFNEGFFVICKINLSFIVCKQIFYIFSQTRHLCGFLEGEPKTANFWQWECDTFAFFAE